MVTRIVPRRTAMGRSAFQRCAALSIFITLLVLGLAACNEDSVGGRRSLDPGKYDGTWVNDDSATNDVTALIISHSGSNITVHGFGACTPTDCVWNTRTALYSGDPFVIMFDFGGGLTHQLTISFSAASYRHVEVIDLGSASVTHTNMFHRGSYPPGPTSDPGKYDGTWVND